MKDSVQIIDYNLNIEDYSILGFVLMENGKVLQLFTNTGFHFDDGTKSRFDLFIEEEIKSTRRMTNYELSKWLTEGNSRFRQVLINYDIVVSHYYYNKCADHTEVPEHILIREDEGEWQDPVVEF